MGIPLATVAKTCRDKKDVTELPEVDIASADLFGGDLDEFSSQDAIQVSVKASIRLLQQALKDAEANYVIVDERMRRIPLKTIMECIEKSVRSYTQLELKTKSSSKNIGVDYKEMAKLYTDASRTGKYYDSEQHMKDLLNLAHGKIK